MKYLIVVDMQVDFITGSLGSESAQAIVPDVLEKVKNFEGKVIFTRDTHFENYMHTQEGKKLPVEHCIKETAGWQICDELKPYVNDVFVGVTHTDYFLIICVSDFEVGIDAEKKDRYVKNKKRIIRKYFSKNEAEYSLDSDEKFLEIWGQFAFEL